MPVKCGAKPAMSLLNNTCQVLTNECYFVLNLESLINKYKGYGLKSLENKMGLSKQCYPNNIGSNQIYVDNEWLLTRFRMSLDNEKSKMKQMEQFVNYQFDYCQSVNELQQLITLKRSLNLTNETLQLKKQMQTNQTKIKVKQSKRLDFCVIITSLQLMLVHVIDTHTHTQIRVSVL